MENNEEPSLDKRQIIRAVKIICKALEEGAVNDYYGQAAMRALIASQEKQGIRVQLIDWSEATTQ